MLLYVCPACCGAEVMALTYQTKKSPTGQSQILKDVFSLKMLNSPDPLQVHVRKSPLICRLQQ
jgi:hypothetical protein